MAITPASVRLERLHRASAHNLNPVLQGLAKVVAELSLGEVSKVEMGSATISVECAYWKGRTSRIIVFPLGKGRVVADIHNDGEHGMFFDLSVEVWEQISIYFESPLVKMAMH